MRINHNIPALQTYHSIKKANKQVTAAMGRLSSGFKINSAKDDAAGLAISNKMRMQIAGLEMASRNSLDGVSMVQTADGALSEVQSMVQRMRELAVSAANDTMEDDDREKVQHEIDNLIKEIDAMANRTEFNTIKLFGSKAKGVYGFDFTTQGDHLSSNAVSPVSTTANFPNVNTTYDIDKAALPPFATNVFTLTLAPVINPGDFDGQTFTLNGETIAFNNTDGETEVMNKIKTLAEKHNYTFTQDSATEFTLTSEKPISTSNSFNATNVETLNNAQISNLKITTPAGTVVPATVTYEGNTIKIDLGKPYLGESISLKVNITETPANSGIYEVDGKPVAANGTIDSGTPIKQNVTYRDYSSINIQTGASQYMEMTLDIPEVTAKSLGVDGLTYFPWENAEAAITICDNAIQQISGVRSITGAAQNRLEHTISSLDVTLENTSAALSRIVDTDMAKDMTFYTSQNVIVQAGMSILAQANQRPQQILQLIG